LGLIAAAKTGGFGVNGFLLMEKVYTRCFSLKLAWNDRFELKKNSSFELIVGLELIFWLSEAKNICLQGVWSVFFFVFSCQNMIKNEFLLIWNRPTWFPMIRCCWNLGNASEELSTSFQRIKGSFFFLKKRPKHVGYS
jgi:hypothetical protein